VTVFLGCGFAAKYREGGGNFSVPLANVKARRFRLQYKCERLYIAFIRLEREKRAANLFG